MYSIWIRSVQAILGHFCSTFYSAQKICSLICIVINVLDVKRKHELDIVCCAPPSPPSIHKCALNLGWDLNLGLTNISSNISLYITDSWGLCTSDHTFLNIFLDKIPSPSSEWVSQWLVVSHFSHRCQFFASPTFKLTLPACQPGCSQPHLGDGDIPDT